MATSTSQNSAVRQLEPHWNSGLIAASIVVSLLGAFTSTQMFCQARTSRYFSGILVWTILGSLTFGFCSIWSLHFIAMLACELDVPIDLNIPWTILSAVLAVLFTFLALISDLLRTRYLGYLKKERSKRRAKRKQSQLDSVQPDDETLEITDPLLGVDGDPDSSTDNTGNHVLLTPDEASHDQLEIQRQTHNRRTSLGPLEDHFHGANGSAAAFPSPSPQLSSTRTSSWFIPTIHESDTGSSEDFDALRSSSDDYLSRRSSATTGSESSDFSLPRFMSFKVAKSTTTEATNVLVGTLKGIYLGATLRNFSRGFIWSLAITSMHYSGIRALRIPQGYFTLNPFAVLLSATISWLVCTLACILIPQIEVNLAQQLLFSVVAATGVAAMHFTGMWATSFWSLAEPTQHRGYPPRLAVAVGAVAVGTCIIANGLLAHTATMARNKLAEVVQTKRKLWAAIAQKENAEAAAAARSEFIASASHEIRTPLHQLQGYSDLLARTPLTEEGRLLLLAIQQATRSLSMITANVLDWSRLEKGEAQCRPSSLDLRRVCESIVHILPHRDDEVETELLVVVAPGVPESVFLDETYLQRILMNLLSNALKFTHSGYVLLMIELNGDVLNIKVQDSGTGIADSFIPQLFEPFKQAQTMGAERGTGLGLAIIKQLLEKMQGAISVESNYFQLEGIGSQKSGSTFDITIPVPASPSSSCPPGLVGLDTGEVAIFEASSGRIMEGFRMAWAAFGFDVILAEPDGEIPASCKIIWTDVKFLSTRPQLLERLLRLQDQFVLVSYETQLSLDQAVGSVPPSHIITIKRPFVWHQIIDSVAKAIRSGKSAVDRTVRFAPTVDFLEDGTPVEEKPALNFSTILLVEDNRINQKLGAKMLKNLGYNVLLADDGEDAIEKVLAHDREIDLILMDQSMPRKDGITAIREIREMEGSGRLSRRRPIVMATAVVGPDAQALCMSAGADAFLTKPLSLSQLEQAMQRFLG